MAENVSDEKVVEVQNLADHIVGFADEETHRRFVFQPYEVKKISAGVLRKLNYSYGGTVLLKDFLSVKDVDLRKEFGVLEETIEYDWTKSDVDKLLTEGSLDSLKDALDFGPEGIKELIVSRAVELKLNDVVKRQTIQEMTGKDINSMIRLLDEMKDSQKEETSAATTRRTATKQTTAGRRVQKKTV